MRHLSIVAAARSMPCSPVFARADAVTVTPLESAYWEPK
jgi:hypothetical protein